MDIKKTIEDILTLPNEKSDKKWYYAPLVPAVLWVVFSFISLFSLKLSIITDPFVIVSILARILLPIYAISFIKKFYITGKLKVIHYNHILNFIGYSISITYVAYMLPSVVMDFHNSGYKSPFLTVMVLLSTLCPASLYLLLKSKKVKLASGYFSKKDVEYEVKTKKDKKLKKENQRRLRKERTFLQNLWFEVADPLLWAILWVLLINNTVFQLYEIPSSSMVSEFLEKDRVVATKLFSGPSLPLTRYHLPEIGEAKVGDIVTFNNPEVDNPNSDLRYKNVFTRIFQPFFYMLTFSKLDIDADENGNPKARQLVKRVIGAPGEKLCMVNDKVYKKVEGGEWTLMSDIPGQKEWGHADLFSLDSPNSGYQFMNPKLRSELDDAAEMVLNFDQLELEQLLVKEKAEFIKNINSADLVDFGNKAVSYNRINDSKINKIKDDLEYSYHQMMQVNKLSLTLSSKKSIVEDFNNSLDAYDQFILFVKIKELSNILGAGSQFIKDQYITDIEIPEDSSPYDSFVIKLDALIRLKSLEIYNSLLTGNELTADSNLLRDEKKLFVYSYGFAFNNYTQPFFGAGNLPEYPAEKDQYIPEGEFFLLGDNRYNSLDSRMGDTLYQIPLVDNGSIFTQTTTVSWEPHTISNEYIHGKVSLILFPFNRFKFF